MSKIFRKDAWIDPSKRAENVLDYVLQDEIESIQQHDEPKVEQSPVTEELQKSPLIKERGTRVKSRVLFITRDTSFVEAGSLQQIQFKSLASMFDEVHIIVLSQKHQTKKIVERLASNMWVYTTSVRYWWMLPFSAYKIAHTQLQFTDGFRPDVVVALDPFESGVSGLAIAEKYNREFQVHISEDFLSTGFKTKAHNNNLRYLMALLVLKYAQSVRTATVSLKEKIQKKYKHLHDISLLPRHYNIESIIEASATPYEKKLFPQFSFTALFVGKLDHESTLFRALDAVRTILTSPSIGFVVLGDGPAKKEFQKRAQLLNIDKQVIFVKDTDQLFAYLKSAHILICTDTTEESDEIVIKAGASGLPILASENELRKDLFVDGESAFLVPKEDTIGFSQKLVKFLNTNALRAQFAVNAQDIVKSRLHEDPEAFKLAYRDCIEQVFSREEKPKKPENKA